MLALAIEDVSVVLPIAPEQAVIANTFVRTVADQAIAAAIRPRILKKLDRFSQIAMVAFTEVEQAMKDADPDRVGLFIGNDFGGWGYVQPQLEDLVISRKSEAINPYVATAWFPAAAQGDISITHGIRGYSKTFSGGLLGSALAIEHAAQRLIDGTIDLAFAGGVEAPDAGIIVDTLVSEERISLNFPANESACLIALRRANGHATPRLVMSKFYRHPVFVLDNLAREWCGKGRIEIHLPQVAPNDERRSRIVEDMRETLAIRLGYPIDPVRTQSGLGDYGSATFALSIARAAGKWPGEKPAEGIALVLGTDFNGLFAAAVVTRN